MPSPGLVARVARAKRSLARLREIARVPWEKYSVDEDLQALAERHLHIVLEAILDLAAFIAARLAVSRGPSYRDVVQALVSREIIPREMAGLALGIPGLRNILVHGYAEIRHDTIYEILQTELGALERLLLLLWSRAEELDP